MTQLERISAQLTEAGIANLIERSTHPESEDDEILITPNIWLQVGEDYIGITLEAADEQVYLWWTTERLLVPQLREVLTSGKDAEALS